MTNETISRKKSGYGTLGMDVGVVGHWARFIFGASLLLWVVASLAGLIAQNSSSAELLPFFGQLLVYFAGITLVYTVVYWVLGERGVLQRIGPWANTAIFVGPAFVVAWWNVIVAPFAGIYLPSAFWLAMLAYIGFSFILQWRLSYGGCEVVALPILLFRKRYPTYCIPLVALDAVEKAVVDNRASKAK